MILQFETPHVLSVSGAYQFETVGGDEVRARPRKHRGIVHLERTFQHDTLQYQVGDACSHRHVWAW